MKCLSHFSFNTVFDYGTFCLVKKDTEEHVAKSIEFRMRTDKVKKKKENICSSPPKLDIFLSAGRWQIGKQKFQGGEKFK